MWSYNRRSFMLMTVALAGCGFTPVYGPKGTGQALFNAIRIESPSTTDSYNLVSYLKTRLGPGDAARYGLSYALKTEQKGLAVTASQTIVRYNILGNLSFSLRDLASNRVMTSGTVSAMTAYSASGTTLATQAARKDANKRLMVALADRLIDRLYLTVPAP